MKDAIKQLAYFCLYYSGIERLLTRWLRVDAAMILMYHGVSETVSTTREVNFHISGKSLDRSLRMMKRRYPLIGMGELLDRLQRGQPLDKHVVLTFDDGYRNNLTRVAPIMKRHSAPFSVYLATGVIGSSRFLPLNEVYTLFASGKLGHAQTMELRSEIRTGTAEEAAKKIASLAPAATEEERAAVAESFAMMSWDEVRELNGQSGVEIGGHTHSHCNMAAEDAGAQRRELELCRRSITENLGEAPILFAYPFGGSGYHNDVTRQNVMEAGFECAITTQTGVVRQGCDPFRLPRCGTHFRQWFQACDMLYEFARVRFGKPR